jgi:hypothetical protein
MKGYFSFITSQELAWGTMTRQGFENEDKNKKNDGDNNPGDNSGGKKPGLFQRLKNKKSSDNDFEPLKT